MICRIYELILGDMAGQSGDRGLGSRSLWWSGAVRCLSPKTPLKFPAYSGSGNPRMWHKFTTLMWKWLSQFFFWQYVMLTLYVLNSDFKLSVWERPVTWASIFFWILNHGLCKGVSLMTFLKRKVGDYFLKQLELNSLPFRLNLWLLMKNQKKHIMRTLRMTTWSNLGFQSNSQDETIGLWVKHDLNLQQC